LLKMVLRDMVVAMLQLRVLSSVIPLVISMCCCKQSNDLLDLSRFAFSFAVNSSGRMLRRGWGDCSALAFSHVGIRILDWDMGISKLIEGVVNSG